MQAPRKRKPTLVDEITRTLQALDILEEQINQRANPPVRVVYTHERLVLLEIAERIAARTED